MNKGITIRKLSGDRWALIHHVHGREAQRVFFSSREDAEKALKKYFTERKPQPLQPRRF